jgi:hypothetical protein
VPTKRATDSNGFHIMAMDANLLTSPPTFRFISVDELFSKAALESSSSIVGHSNAATSYALADIESAQDTARDAAHVAKERLGGKWISISVAQLFASAASAHPLVVAMPAAAGDEHTRRARQLRFIEAGIHFGCEDEISQVQGQTWTDPAVVSCKVSGDRPVVDPKPVIDAAPVPERCLVAGSCFELSDSSAEPRLYCALC